MSVSEAERHDLYNGLNDLLGTRRADTLMAFLPTETNLATRDDLLDLEARLGARIDGLDVRIDQAETRLGARIDGLGARINQVETGLGARIDQVETGLGARIDQVETGLGARIDQMETSLGARMDEFNRRLDRFFLTMVTGLFAMVASLIAAVFIG